MLGDPGIRCERLQFPNDLLPTDQPTVKSAPPPAVVGQSQFRPGPEMLSIRSQEQIGVPLAVGADDERPQAGTTKRLARLMAPPGIGHEPAVAPSLRLGLIPA